MSGPAPLMEARMERTTLTLFGVLAAGIISFAQGGAAPPPPPLEPGALQADVDKALIAAPANQKNQATVVKWKPDFTYETLRKGTNRMVCYDRSGFPQQQPFSVQCTSIATSIAWRRTSRPRQAATGRSPRRCCRRRKRMARG